MFSHSLHPTSSFVRVIMGVGFGATLAASGCLEHRQLGAVSGRSPKWGAAEKFDG